MAKSQSPLLGYNTNIRHKGKVFHIQTEDSGILKPHVMTHLFADGGRVLKSQKSTYAHLLDTDDVALQVKKLMQDQHKAMFIALREGQFDEMAGVNVAAPAPEASLPTDESNTVPPAAPTPLTPSAPISRGAPSPPPPRTNLPPAPSAPPPPLPVAASVVPLPVMTAAAAVAARPAVFGESLVSERSLDEVILAFLAEELEGSRAV